MANCIKSSNYTTAVTTITTIPKGIKLKFRRIFLKISIVRVTTCCPYAGCQKAYQQYLIISFASEIKT